MSRAAAVVPVAVDADSLTEEFLRRGRHRGDFGGDVIEELGFSLGFWNNAQPAVGFNVAAGGFPSVPGLLNCFVLDLPRPDEAVGLYRSEVANAIMDAVVEAWEPEWATWTSGTLRDAQDLAAREPVVGWLTYLRGGVASVPLWEVRSLGVGSVVQSSPELAGADEGTVLALRGYLQRIGALRPIPFEPPA